MFDIIEALFENTWKFFGIEYPGTGMTFATIGIGALSVVLALRILGAVTGFSFSGDDAAAARSLLIPVRRGGNSKALIISDERKGDRF